MRSSWTVRVILAILLATGASAGCSDSTKNADPKPVNVKEDPRLKRTISGSENKTSRQLPAPK